MRTDNYPSDTTRTRSHPRIYLLGPRLSPHCGDTATRESIRVSINTRRAL
jgi:hypothetical protein